MFTMIGATLFFVAGAMSVMVVVQSLRGYGATMIAALRGEPLPRALPHIDAPSRQRRLTSQFMPRRLAPVRVAA